VFRDVVAMFCELGLRICLTDDYTIAGHLYLGAASFSTNTEGTTEFPPCIEQSAGECGCVLFVDCGGVASCGVAKLSYAGTAFFWAEVT
jgi:hypothetical protein